MSSFRKQAQTLEANGFNIVPINKGKKAPLITGWQDKTFTADDVAAGVGVKCGIGEYPICAIDIDSKDELLARKIADHCHESFGYTVERVGNAPKTLLVYRADEAGWSKLSSRKFGADKYQVETLGKGQQFVAYAVHPVTGKPYEWVDLFGGLEVMQASDLPVITHDQLEQIIAYAEQVMLDAGLEPVKSVMGIPATNKGSLSKVNDDFTADMPLGLSHDGLKDYLANLDANDYDLWIKIGQALHHETGGDADGLNLWDDWSSKAHNYQGYDDIAHRWASFGKGGNPVTARTIIKLGNEANAQAEIDLKKAVVAEYKAKIEKTATTYELEIVAKEIGKQVNADDFAMVNEVQSTIKEHWKIVSTTAITKPAINTMMGLKKTYGIEDVIKVRSFTEEGNAIRLIQDQNGKIMYIAETDMWYLWDGNHWRKSSSVEIEQLARETINKLVQDYMDLSDGIMGEDLEFLKKSFESKMITNMVKFTRSDKAVLTSFDNLDGNRLLLGVGNGSVDLTTGKLFEPNPQDHITIVSPVDYTPKAQCPVWKQTLNDIFNNDVELIHYVQKLIGYSVMANPVESLFVIMWGDGSNGKSTFINTIRDVLGNHAKVANSETFLGTAANSSGSPREDILRLLGSRIVTITEPDEGGVLREGLIKAMTGGEALPARAAYGRTTVEVKPTWTAFMPTNHKPIIKGTDHGIWRRMVLIPFTVNFDNHPTLKKDPERANKLKAEYEGVLAWIVEGALLYQKEGLKAPKVIEDARNEYKDEMDLLSDWIKQDCVVGNGEVATNKALWESWQRFAQANGELKYISSSRMLSRRLSSRFEVAKNIGKEKMRGFKGISVKNTDEFEDVE